ncbi:MAG: helix-turn-helix domain-containing protein [Lachnospiraceae bacterium]|nr:helix-turn-helix domain-containing protein [Lachnospiraceae bacterium]
MDYLDIERINQALGTKNRIALLTIMKDKVYEKKELSELLSLRNETLSQHLRALKRANIVNEYHYNRKTYYTVNVATLREYRKKLTETFRMIEVTAENA